MILLPTLYLDLHPDTNTLLSDVVDGLSKDQKTLPSKYFYDKRGSALFDLICELDEYYPTRSELSILGDNIDEIQHFLGESVILVEYGSGSSTKTRLLLDAIPQIDAYVPIDISREHLLDAASNILAIHPEMKVLPVCADYSQTVHLDLSPDPGSHITAFFPGSTIGNFKTASAIEFLKRVHTLVGVGGGLLIGVDLEKDKGVIESAYNDLNGVTAEFNKNILLHINDRIGSAFDLDTFEHRAIYNFQNHRIEMFLESTVEQVITINGSDYSFDQGETILTEYSHKYTLNGFEDLATKAGFTVDKVWTDCRLPFFCSIPNSQLIELLVDLIGS